VRVEIGRAISNAPSSASTDGLRTSHPQLLRRSDLDQPLLTYSQLKLIRMFRCDCFINKLRAARNVLYLLRR
jgi:hypothetical protein